MNNHTIVLLHFCKSWNTVHHTKLFKLFKVLFYWQTKCFILSFFFHIIGIYACKFFAIHVIITKGGERRGGRVGWLIVPTGWLIVPTGWIIVPSTNHFEDNNSKTNLLPMNLTILLWIFKKIWKEGYKLVFFINFC